MRSFLMFFYLLDQCWDRCKEDHLGVFLGMICPELWEDGRPMDQAVYLAWKQHCADQPIADAAYGFLEQYENRFGFDFSQTKICLRSIVDDEMLEEAKRYADRMDRKYHYEE